MRTAMTLLLAIALSGCGSSPIRFLNTEAGQPFIIPGEPSPQRCESVLCKVKVQVDASCKWTVPDVVYVNNKVKAIIWDASSTNFTFNDAVGRRAVHLPIVHQGDFQGDSEDQFVLFSAASFVDGSGKTQFKWDLDRVNGSSSKKRSKLFKYELHLKNSSGVTCDLDPVIVNQD